MLYNFSRGKLKEGWRNIGQEDTWEAGPLTPHLGLTTVLKKIKIKKVTKMLAQFQFIPAEGRRSQRPGTGKLG